MNDDRVCEQLWPPRPAEADSDDPEVLRAALLREVTDRGRAECIARMQTDIVTLAVELLVREPDVVGFFGALTRTMVEEAESHTCGVWLLDESGERCELWMAYAKDHLITPAMMVAKHEGGQHEESKWFCQNMASHLFAHRDGWNQTVEYSANDQRLPASIREFSCAQQWDVTIATPLTLAGRNLGWMTVSSARPTDCQDGNWWRIVLMEAIAQQASLALHHSRVVAQSRIEERRKAILEERNRLARDIHDNLAQGFAAILMQLQGARREAGCVPPTLAAKLDTAVDLARTHLIEARRSVGTLRPNVGDGEEVAAALKRIAGSVQRTTDVPIDVVVDELPRFGDAVEREIIGIAQEALSNAVRHSRARRITVSAATVRAIGVRLSVADDGRGIGHDRTGSSGFGLTSMQERAERIGASLTIVTAPRSGTEIVLAWEPSNLPTQVHSVS